MVQAEAGIREAAVTGAHTCAVPVKDANNNVISGIAAANVVLASTGTGNTLTQPSAATDANGQTTGTLKSTTAAVKTVSVTISATAITATTPVTFTAGGRESGRPRKGGSS